MHLSDSALMRVVGCEPTLPTESCTALAGALAKLGAQFIREGRCAAFHSEWAAIGQLLVIAWDGPALSGCSHDKLNQVLAQHEARAGVRMLEAPPLAIGEASDLRLVDRQALRQLVQQGVVTAQTRCWPRTAETLGAWRQGPVPLSASPFARLVAS